MHLQRNQRQELKTTDSIKCGMTTRGFYLSQMNSLVMMIKASIIVKHRNIRPSLGDIDLHLNGIPPQSPLETLVALGASKRKRKDRREYKRGLPK